MCARVCACAPVSCVSARLCAAVAGGSGLSGFGSGGFKPAGGTAGSGGFGGAGWKAAGECSIWKSSGAAATPLFAPSKVIS